MRQVARLGMATKKQSTGSLETLIPDYGAFLPDGGVQEAAPYHWHVVMSGAEIEPKASGAVKTQMQAQKLCRIWLKQLRERGCHIRGTMRSGVFQRCESGTGIWDKLEIQRCSHEHCEVGETASKLQGVRPKSVKQGQTASAPS